MTYKTLDYWQKRYKELLSILEKLQNETRSEWSQDGSNFYYEEWSVHKGKDIDVKQLDENLPLDFIAFLSVFGADGQIGTSGMALIGFDIPSNYKKSEIFNIYYSNHISDDDKDEIFDTTEIKLNDILWFGYTAIPFNIIGFNKSSLPYKVISNYHAEETFDELICSLLNERREFCTFSKELNDWLKHRENHD